MKVKVNINNAVRTTLTPEGLKEYNKQGSIFFNPKTDPELKCSLWELMNRFGPWCSIPKMGTLFVDNEIEITTLGGPS